MNGNTLFISQSLSTRAVSSGVLSNRGEYSVPPLLPQLNHYRKRHQKSRFDFDIRSEIEMEK